MLFNCSKAGVSHVEEIMSNSCCYWHAFTTNGTSISDLLKQTELKYGIVKQWPVMYTIKYVTNVASTVVNSV